MIPATASQTIGPYWHLVEDPAWADLTRFGAPAPHIRLTGTLMDGNGAPCPGACLELWQPTPEPSPTWDGFGRANTNAHGTYAFTTIRPTPVPLGRGRNAHQAPHAALTILSRGLMTHLHTRIYFAGDPRNDEDPLLASLPPARRATLLAVQDPNDPATWRLDIHLQGDNETVFLDI